MRLVLIVLLILLLVGGLPNWHGYGYYPSSIFGVLLVVVLVLALVGAL